MGPVAYSSTLPAPSGYTPVGRPKRASTAAMLSPKGGAGPSRVVQAASKGNMKIIFLTTLIIFSSPKETEIAAVFLQTHELLESWPVFLYTSGSGHLISK